MSDIPLVVLLEVGNRFFAWPSWRSPAPDGSGLDYEIRTIPTGVTQIGVIPEFFWPEVDELHVGLLFYGAMLTPDFSGLTGNISMLAWGYGP